MIFKTKCCYCNKNIKIQIPFKFRRFREHKVFSCNKCVPADSVLRNGMDEIPFTEI